MRNYLLTIVLCVAISSAYAQATRDFVIVTVENDRKELLEVVRLLNSTKPKLVCLNFNLDDCNVDSVDKQLRYELADIPLLLPTEVRSFGHEEFIDVTGCSYFYDKGIDTGFINLISNDFMENQVEKFQVSNRYGSLLSYHIAVNIAFVLNAKKAQFFIEAQKDTVNIEFKRRRKFSSFSFSDFVKNKVAKKVLDKKIVIVGLGPGWDSFLIKRTGSKKNGFEKMSTSAIFANIACQIVGD